ncbi:MAG TPA: methionyl-tRNA formyltransferase [Pyrinomonadaceae bacterium]|nr:methionyl-tRNA formyltransferase [Pyrinomonadaceae bacterium]
MRLVFMGTPESAVPSLRRCVEDGHEVVAVWTQPDRPAGRGKKLHVPPVKEFALARGIPVHQPAKIRTDAAFDLFCHADADAAVVVAYGRILPSAFLRTPRRGCLNVHFSLLPKYRGAAPVNWAIVRGERATGVTTMLIDEGLDTGAILLRRETVIGERETAPELLARLSIEGAELLGETLRRFDEIEPRAQDDAEATLAPMLKREDGRIDWTLDASDIERRIRGFQPWPNAHTEYKGHHLVIREAATVVAEVSGAATKATPGQVIEATPGRIIEASGDSLVVACGAGTALRLTDLQLEGKRRMSARDFINGTHVAAGESLGAFGEGAEA